MTEKTAREVMKAKYKSLILLEKCKFTRGLIKRNDQINSQVAVAEATNKMQK